MPPQRGSRSDIRRGRRLVLVVGLTLAVAMGGAAYVHWTGQTRTDPHRQDAATRGAGDDDAIAAARRRVRETGGSDESLLALARLLSDVDPASPVPPPIAVRPDADLVHAELLEGRGENDAAAQIYENLLRTSENCSLPAWRGLARVRSAQHRDWEFVQRLTSVIEQPGRLRPEDVAELVLLRALSRDGMKHYEHALDDYQTVLESQPDNLVALNNAAWVINAHIAWPAEELVARREYALNLSDRAVELAPTSEPIRHTKATILEALERWAEALAELDEIIAILDETLAREPQSPGDTKLLEQARSTRTRYVFHKAALRREMER